MVGHQQSCVDPMGFWLYGHLATMPVGNDPYCIVSYLIEEPTEASAVPTRALVRATCTVGAPNLFGCGRKATAGLAQEKNCYDWCAQPQGIALGYPHLPCQGGKKAVVPIGER
jgi:hypothetical protein